MTGVQTCALPILVGHVGRFLKVKNHDFLIDIFVYIKKIKPNAILMLVGQGEKQEEIKQKVKKHGIENSVLFLGSRSNVNQLMQAMDVFVLPSLYEGIPLVGIEAQATGLPCVFSQGVPSEVALTKDCTFLNLTDSVEYWAEQISKITVKNRQDGAIAVREKGYDIFSASIKLQNQYLLFKQN